MTIMSV